MTGCWLAARGLVETPCSGRLVRAHLIPKQRIKREVAQRAIRNVQDRQRAAWPDRWEHVSRSAREAEMDRLVWDARVWVPVCGGPTGSAGHHGDLDYSRKVRIPRMKLPPELEEFAVEYGLEWSLERDYGLKES